MKIWTAKKLDLGNVDGGHLRDVTDITKEQAQEWLEELEEIEP